jgi:ABC-type polar amino acid transport system ATPase subunit
MESLASEGMTMLIVTHEMGFARRVADRAIFMDQGQIIEIAPPDDFFDRPQSPRLQTFLGQLHA